MPCDEAIFDNSSDDGKDNNGEDDGAEPKAMEISDAPPA